MKELTGLSLPEYSFGTAQTISIVGAGLAGCATAHALVKRGYSCRVYDQHSTEGAATSALPFAVIRPAISGDEFFKDYFDCAFELCCQSIEKKFFTQCGALELTDKPTSDQPANDQPAGSYTCELVTADQASTLAGTKLNSGAHHISDAGFVSPQALCNHWLQHSAIDFQPNTEVCALRKTHHGWQLLTDTGVVIDESQIVVLATAHNINKLDITSELPLQPAAGQIDLFEHDGAPVKRIINSHGYLLPEARGVWCGATHHRDQLTGAVCASDSQSNKSAAASIAPSLSTGELPVASFRAIRTFTPDRLAVVGAAHDQLQYRKDYADLKHGPVHSRRDKQGHQHRQGYPAPTFHKGLYLAAGLGSRGATQAMLIGELLSDLISGDYQQHNDQSTQQNELPRQDDGRRKQQFLHALHPARFLIRALKRGI